MPETAAFHVPAIDISPYIAGGSAEEKQAVARAFDEAARTVGFMQITGHGIPLESWARLGRASDRFFELSLEQKKRYRAPKGVNRGYSPPKSERLSLSLGVEKAERMNDFFEAFNVGATAADYAHAGVSEADYADNIWPEETETFRDDVELWMTNATAVAHVMMAIFADALGLPSDYFAAYTDHSLNVLRMNNYALPEGERVTLDGDLIGMGEHTDFGIVTLLWADDVKGLQVLGEDGSWNDVSPLPGALLVNLGDLTARWTNEKWKSTLHRVKPPVVGGTIKRRRSAAFFFDGNVDALITTLPGCVEPGERELYAPITVSEHIQAKLRGSRELQKNTGDIEREAQRVLSSRY
ncbi:isopenicillin N synthase family dioxygenase [Galbitalea soli]|uniref:isopenicillin N synthase family dioxygenase n=1 Tax=Galbitalea soli TaxID=1268042 RepID=UPI0018159D00|nr:isopenicillin N synthase-like dioxygenase [Galbitalea soli]